MPIYRIEETNSGAVLWFGEADSPAAAEADLRRIVVELKGPALAGYRAQQSFVEEFNTAPSRSSSEDHDWMSGCTEWSGLDDLEQEAFAAAFFAWS